MRVMCASDSFKESLSARDAVAAMARGVMLASPEAEVDLCPIADGGEGTVDALIASTCGDLLMKSVCGPLPGVNVAAQWGMLGDIGRAIDGVRGGKAAVIEMASASGLTLIDELLRNPLNTTTFGIGELLLEALDHGAERIILGLGGSATCDGGCGAAQALGARFYDLRGTLIKGPITGGMLQEIGSIDLRGIDQRIRRVDLVIACDVNNPFYGPLGAAHVYAPQKGASHEQVKILDRGLEHLAVLIHKQLKVDVTEQPGAGAAGGLGGGAMAFFGGHLRRGVQLILEAVEFNSRIKMCDLCLTGEGKLDSQSLSGKATMGVVKAAAEHNVPAVTLVGRLGDVSEKVLAMEFKNYRIIGEHLPLTESIEKAAELLEQVSADVVRGFVSCSQ